MNNKITFEVINKSWHKRRAATAPIVDIVSVEIPDYQPTHGFMCDMHITYSDQSQVTLLGRVLQNKITKQWTVDGMRIAVRVLDM